LAAGEGKGAKEIELGDDPQDLSVFHNRKRIEVVFFEQPSQFTHCRLRFHGRYRPRHELSRRAREKAVHSFTTSISRFHSLDFLFVSSAARVCPILYAHKPLADEGMAVLSLARPRMVDRVLAPALILRPVDCRKYSGLVIVVEQLAPQAVAGDKVVLAPIAEVQIELRIVVVHHVEQGGKTPVMVETALLVSPQPCQRCRPIHMGRRAIGLKRVNTDFARRVQIVSRLGVERRNVEVHSRQTEGGRYRRSGLLAVGAKCLAILVQLGIEAARSPTGENLLHGVNIDSQEISERLEVRRKGYDCANVQIAVSPAVEPPSDSRCERVVDGRVTRTGFPLI
jgi:hypothetical protein